MSEKFIMVIHTYFYYRFVKINTIYDFILFKKLKSLLITALWGKVWKLQIHINFG